VVAICNKGEVTKQGYCQKRYTPPSRPDVNQPGSYGSSEAAPSPPPGNHFVLSGGPTCAEGVPFVSSEQHCSRVANMFGFEVEAIKDSSSSYPKGCYLYRGRKLYFNRDGTDSSKKGSARVFCFVKGPELAPDREGSDKTRGGCACRETWVPSPNTCVTEPGMQYSGCGMAKPCDGDSGGQPGGSWCLIDSAQGCKPAGGAWDYCIPKS